MTPADRRDDTALWDEVHDRLVRYAASLGVGIDNAEDIAQETLGRAIARNVPFADPDDLLRWCQRVAHNQAMDEHRRRRRVVCLSETDTGEAVKDVADEVVSRDLLERTLHALGGLAAGQREAILSVARDDAPTTGDRREQVRLAVARSRARVHLRAAVGYVGVLVGVMLAPVRRAGRLAPITSVAAAAVIGATMTALPPSGHSTSTPAAPHRTAPAAKHVDTRMKPEAMDAPQRVEQRAQPVPTLDQARPPAPRRAKADMQLAHVHHAGAVVAAKHRPQRPDDHLLCLSGGPLDASVCVG